MFLTFFDCLTGQCEFSMPQLDLPVTAADNIQECQPFFFNGHTSESTVQNLVRKCKVLFAPELGIVQDVKVHLLEKESATPKFF